MPELDNPELQMQLGRLVGAAPWLLLVLGGGVLCLIGESRPVRVRTLVGCAMAIELLQFVVMPLVIQRIASEAQQAGGGILTWATVSFVGSLVSAMSLGLLLWAAFTPDEPPHGAP